MSEPASLADVARVAVEDFRRRRPDAISGALVGDLVSAMELALLTAVRGERRACVAECTRRAELWESTGERAGVPDQVRQEAVHRENEARYLADLLATRS